jgi:hypothetical protein
MNVLAKNLFKIFLDQSSNPVTLISTYPAHRNVNLKQLKDSVYVRRSTFSQ